MEKEEKHNTYITRTEYTITTLNSMKKDNLKQLCMDYNIQTGNLKKKDQILLIVDCQRCIGSTEENNYSDISSITDV